MDQNIKVELVPIQSVIPYETNPKKHTQTQIDRIANSISEFGMNQPIVIDENNVLLVGHGRLEAIKKLGKTAIPAIKISHLTKSQKKAWRILDNKLAQESDWDFESLQSEIKMLAEEHYNIEEWGLDEFVEPEFETSSEEEQSSLDERALIQCPECGHEFAKSET